MPHAYLVDGVRTPIGRYAGSLAAVRPDDMGAHVIRKLLKKLPSVAPDAIDEVIFGCANQAGEDNRNVARMSALLAGLPTSVPGTTINRLCGSGLDAIGAAARAIKAGEIDLQATLTQAENFRKGFNPDALESWRAANGAFELTRLVSTKGKARIDGSGQLLLDPLHRVAGDLQLAAAGIEQIGGLRIGNLLGGLGGFLGGRGGNTATAPGLTTLPPVSLREGRVFIGPFRLPLQPLPPLY